MRLLLLCLLSACWTSPPHAAPTPTEAPAPRAAAVGTVDQTRDDRRRWMHAPLVVYGDLDGVQGHERVMLSGSGTLTVGTRSIRVELAAVSGVFHDQYRLEIVPLGRGRRGVLVASPIHEDEDPPNRYRVYLYDRGALRKVFDQVIGVYGVTPLVFAADGTAAYTESGWMACTRVQGTSHVPRQQVTLALDAAGSAMQVVRRTNTAEIQACDELSACPFVYRLDGGTPHLLGEILRDVRGRAAATTQALPVGVHGAAGRITLRLAEEKPEVTYLDELYLDVDGVHIVPPACTATHAPAYCAADGRYHVLREGDALDVVFDAPAHVESQLVARGYYVPTPTRRRRAE